MNVLSRALPLHSSRLGAVARRSYAHPPTSRSVPHVPLPSSNETKNRLDILRATPLSIKTIMFGLTLLGFSTGILIGSKAPRPPTADDGATSSPYSTGAASSAPASPYAALKKRAAEQAAGGHLIEPDGLTKGIEELRSFFRTLGREDDVVVQPAGPGYKNPTVVVRALRTEEIQRVVSTAIKFSIPLINYKDITSSTSGGIVLDLTRLRAQ